MICSSLEGLSKEALSLIQLAEPANMMKVDSGGNP